jgi:transposase
MSGSEREGGKRRRRIWSDDDKRRIVAETFAQGTSMSVIARRHDLNANQLFSWRRKFAATPSTPPAVTFVPAAVTEALIQYAPAPCASGHRMLTIVIGPSPTSSPASSRATLRARSTNSCLGHTPPSRLKPWLEQGGKRGSRLVEAVARLGATDEA